MEKHFDHRLSNHIRAKLRDYEEPYELGAWESFNRNRQKRKRKLIILYRSLAASICLVILFTFMPGNITKHQAFISFYRGKHSTALGIDSTKVEGPLEDTPTHINKEILAKNLSMANEEKTTNNKLLPSKPTQNEKIVKNVMVVNNHTNFQTDPNDTKIANVEPLPRLEYIDSFMFVTYPKLMINGTLSNTQHGPGSKMEPGYRAIRFGLTFNNSLNQFNTGDAPGGGSNTEIGVVSRLPVGNGIQVSSGMILAMYDLERIEDLPVNLSSQLSNTQTEKFSAVNLDIPMNIEYAFRLSKDKSFFTSVGVSNLVRLNTRVETENEIEREVLLIQKINGVENLSTIVETSITESSSFDDQINFIPASSINVSIGYQTPISDHLSLRLAPFYRYPVNQFLGEPSEFFIIGLHTSIYLEK